MKTNTGKKKSIKEYSTAIIEGLVNEVSASSCLKHRLTKGELRELLVKKVLKRFLTTQFSIGTGVIVNQREDQSDQTDIIIYDNRILPPLMGEAELGVYPAESVLGTIEVKSLLDKKAILTSEKSARKLYEDIYNRSSSIYPEEFEHVKPISAIIGFYGPGAKELQNQATGRSWLEGNIKYIKAICLVSKFSWLSLTGKGWVKSSHPARLEETKRFIASYVDNLRTLSLAREMLYRDFLHKDWLSVYIRKKSEDLCSVSWITSKNSSCPR